MTSADIAFDDDGQPVPTCGFAYPVEGDASEVARDEAALRREIVSRVFHFLLSGDPSPTKVGHRVHLVAYLTRQSPCRSQKELAARLGVTEAAVSLRLKSLVEDLATLASDS